MRQHVWQHGHESGDEHTNTREGVDASNEQLEVEGPLLENVDGDSECNNLITLIQTSEDALDQEPIGTFLCLHFQNMWVLIWGNELVSFVKSDCLLYFKFN